jgi:hypothetical protein
VTCRDDAMSTSFASSCCIRCAVLCLMRMTLLARALAEPHQNGSHAVGRSQITLNAIAHNACADVNQILRFGES